MRPGHATTPDFEDFAIMMIMRMTEDQARKLAEAEGTTLEKQTEEARKMFDDIVRRHNG